MVQAGSHGEHLPRPPRPAPLLLPAACFAVGIALAELVAADGAWLGSARWGLVIAALALVVVLLVGRRPRGRVVLGGLLGAAAVLAGAARHQLSVSEPDVHVGRLLGDERVLTRVRGRVVTTPTVRPAVKRNPYAFMEPQPRAQFVLRLQAVETGVEPRALRGLVRVSVLGDGANVRLGDDVVVTGHLARPPPARNPGETDWAAVWRYRGLSASLVVPDAGLIERRSSARAWSVARWRAAITGRTQAYLLDTAGLETDGDGPQRLIATMVLGRRGAADEALNETFRRVGGMHFLAVSGFHVGVIAGLVWLVLRAARVPRPLRGWGVIAALLAYLLVADPNAPVLRAVTMGVALCVALGIGRPVCVLNSLAGAGLLLLAANPLELFRPGFQLSFLQVLMLVTVFPSLYRLLIERRQADAPPRDVLSWAGLWRRRMWRVAGGLALVCVTAWVTAAPLVWLHFGVWAPWGPLQSFVLTPLVIMVVWLGAAALLLGAVPGVGGVLAAVLGGGLTASASVLLGVAGVLGGLPGALVAVAPPAAWLVGATYLGAAMVWGLWQRSTRVTSGGDVAAEARRRAARRHTARRASVFVVGPLVVGWLAWLMPASATWETQLVTAAQAAPAMTIDTARAAPGPAATGDIQAVVLSVGAGNCVLLIAPDRSALVVDCGTIGNSDIGVTAANALRALGARRVAAIALSHANFDHYSGAASLAREFPPTRWLVSPYFIAAAREAPSMRRFRAALPEVLEAGPIEAGARFSFGAAEVEVLWPAPSAATWPANERSLVLRVWHGGRSLLLPGDIEGAALEALVARHRRGEINLLSDVLVAPHHGAVVPGATAAFLEAVAPRAVINSTGRPRPAFRALLRELWGDAAAFYSTADAGAVGVRMGGDGSLAIGTYAGGEARPRERTGGAGQR